MKASSTLLAVFLVASAVARAQVVPAVQGPYGLPVSGTLHYDLRYTQTAQFYGGLMGTVQNAILSGEVAYANTSPVLPFNVTYSGGDSWTISGTQEGTGVFQNLAVSQGLNRRDWSLRLSDDVSYMPQAPVTGFSGILGVGTLPSQPSQPSQPILTLNTRSIYNTVSPSFTHTLGHATSLEIGAGYAIMRFPDGNGLDTNSVQANGQVTRRLDARNSISGQYAYSHSSYPGYSTFTMDTQSAMFGYQRTWSRRLNTSVSAGPQWLWSSDSLIIPASTSLAANASANYSVRSTSAVVSYYRATTGGAGEAAVIATHNDDVNGGVTQQLGRNLTVSATGGYMRTRGLAVQLGQAVVTNAEYGGGSATRRLGRYINVFANYTVIQQSSNSGLSANIVNGLSQVIGFGVSYSPRDINLKR
jgi:hypothetical protein